MKENKRLTANVDRKRQQLDQLINTNFVRNKQIMIDYQNSARSGRIDSNITNSFICISAIQELINRLWEEMVRNTSLLTREKKQVQPMSHSI